MVDFITYWHKNTGFPIKWFLTWLDLPGSKYYDWKARYGQPNAHNAPLPRSFWLLEWEKQAIIEYYLEHPQEGYRRLTFMMLDEDVVAVSPSSVYRLLKSAGLLSSGSKSSSRKGKGFHQPTRPHQHWHVDVSYINICGTFYYLCSILDGYSRYIVHWEIRESMLEREVEIIIQRAREKYPDAAPRIISDNGPQFIARDFKEFIRISGMTHVRTSPYYPQSNGKLERFHKTIKGECIRPKTPLSIEDARRVVGEYVLHYNETRLHSAIGYVTPRDKLEGREGEIFALRDRRLDQARQRRRKKRSGTRKPEGEQDQGEIPFLLDHATEKPQGRWDCQVETGISAPCGPTERGEGVMPDFHLTEPTGRGIEQERMKTTVIETVPTCLTPGS